MITDISQLDPNKTYSYADYLTWQFEDMVELIKGKLFINSPAPAHRHQLIAANLFRDISNHFRKHPCRSYFAPFDVRLVKERKEDKDVFTVVQPDICVICDMSKMDDRGYAGSPDLIIEIISPSTAKKDIDYKYRLYEENGVKEYWIVFPDSNAINQYFLSESKYEQKGLFVNGQRFNSVIFPNLEINLEDIFYS